MCNVVHTVVQTYHVFMIRFGLALSSFIFSVWIDKEKPGSKNHWGLTVCVCVIHLVDSFLLVGDPLQKI